jgi:hypothetical protein
MPEKPKGPDDTTPQDSTPEGTPQDLTAGDTTGATNPAVPTVTPEPVAPVVTPEPVVQASDTTIPGGKYLLDGKYVDANGDPIKE